MIFKPLVLTMMAEYLAGQKTQTRRLIRPQPDEDGLAKLKGELIWHDTSAREYRPPVQPGEFIWWRERLEKDRDGAIYATDRQKVVGVMWHWKYKVLPSIFMPKRACRAVAELLEVLPPHRIQNISRADIRAEGVMLPPSIRRGRDKKTWGKWSELHCEFADYWNTLHGPGAWEENKWCWAYVFRPLRGDELKQALEVLNA